MPGDRLDIIALAIASAHRRTILERVAERPATMSELAELLKVSLPAVTKHLHVLLDAELVRRTKRGRTVTVELVPGSLEPLHTWALSTRLLWAARLDRFAAHLSTSPVVTPESAPAQPDPAQPDPDQLDEEPEPRPDPTQGTL